jgi:hypothetical protein
MCDICWVKCKCGDGDGVEMHLADYNTAPDEIEIYCGKCVPIERKDGILWKYRDSKKEFWKMVFVKALTDNAKNNADGNHPNAMDIEMIGVPDGTLEIFEEVQLPGKNG